MLKLPGDSIRVLVEGIVRGRVEKVLFETPYFKCAVEEMEVKEPEVLTATTEALMRSVLSSFEDYLNLNQKLPQEIFHTVIARRPPRAAAPPGPRPRRPAASGRSGARP